MIKSLSLGLGVRVRWFLKNPSVKYEIGYFSKSKLTETKTETVADTDIKTSTWVWVWVSKAKSLSLSLNSKNTEHIFFFCLKA